MHTRDRERKGETKIERERDTHTLRKGRDTGMHTNIYARVRERERDTHKQKRERHRHIYIHMSARARGGERDSWKRRQDRHM